MCFGRCCFLDARMICLCFKPLRLTSLRHVDLVVTIGPEWISSNGLRVVGTLVQVFLA